MTDSINDKARDYARETAGVDEVKAYTAGYNQCEKDMREKASEGFEEWYVCTNKSKIKNSEGIHIFYLTDLEATWQTATLSAYKRHAEEIRVKDERIEALEIRLGTCKNDYWFMTNLLERYSSDLASSVKDCIDRMKHRKPIFNILSSKEGES